MAIEPEELWLNRVEDAEDDRVTTGLRNTIDGRQSASAPTGDARTVEPPDGLEGWPRQGRRFWSGLLTGECARFLDTLTALADDETAKALFGKDSDAPATRLLVLLFDCFGGMYSPAMDWRTWCSTADAVISVVDRDFLGAVVSDERLRVELLGLCQELFRDSRLEIRHDLEVTVVEPGTFRIGPAPLVCPVQTLLGLRPATADAAVARVSDGAAAAVVVGMPAVATERVEALGLAGDLVATAANARRKRKAGGLHVAGADGGSDGGGVCAPRAKRRDAR